MVEYYDPEKHLHPEIPSYLKLSNLGAELAQSVIVQDPLWGRTFKYHFDLFDHVTCRKLFLTHEGLNRNRKKRYVKVI